MRTTGQYAAPGLLLLALAFGCGEPSASESSERAGGTGNVPAVAVGAFELTVDVDQADLEIGEGRGPNSTTLVDGHTVQVYNGPAGCGWNAQTSALTCEILFRNLDSDECMRNVRTRIGNSTNPSAIMTGADYIWPGPTIVPNTAQPINESGYCITETSPNSSGSSEGCSNTWQDNIPPGAIATQNFVFTNVLEGQGQYRAYLQVFADYRPCSAPAGMARIPAGCFNLGDAFGEGAEDERPVHNVCITSDFYLDEHEVTNAEYEACVSAEACTAPSDSGSFSRGSYYGNPTDNNFPVIWVSWGQATAYCVWAGKRLPTEAEWEYAARGGLSGRRYPWGDPIGGANANYLDSGDAWDNDTSPVASYAANGYGLYDMAGNNWEMVNDWYLDTYYGASPTNDPYGPASGTERGLRGGSWFEGPGGLRVALRDGSDPLDRFDSVGFRCAGAPIDLGAAADFAILAGSAISSVPTSAITGDVGLSPTAGSFITGLVSPLTCPEVNGTVFKIATAGPGCAVVDPDRLIAAKAALTAAYHGLAGRAVPAPIPVAGDQGGVTLPAGIYKSGSSLGIGAGNLTLDGQGNANGVWIFQIGSTLTTTGCGAAVPCATGGNVLLKNGADAANVFWVVGTAATIGDYTDFAGTILAHDDITINTGARIHGRLLAGAQPSGAGAITLIADTVIVP